MQQPRGTALGYRTCRCRARRCVFNERTGTPFNHQHVSTDIALLLVLWRLRHTLRLRDVAEMFPHAWLHLHARDGMGVGGALRLARHDAAARQAAGHRWNAVARGRDIPGSRRPVVLSVPRDRSRRHPRRGAAQRATRQGRRAAVLRPRPGRCRSCLRAGDDGWIRRRLPRHPRGLGQGRDAPHESRQEQPDRARPLRYQATLLPAVRVRAFRVSRALRHRLRGATAVLPTAYESGRAGRAGRSTPVPGVADHEYWLFRTLAAPAAGFPTWDRIGAVHHRQGAEMPPLLALGSPLTALVQRECGRAEYLPHNDDIDHRVFVEIATRAVTPFSRLRRGNLPTRWRSRNRRRHDHGYGNILALPHSRCVAWADKW